MTKQKPGYTLRMPDDLEERLRTAANTSGRSLNQEIITRLESTFRSGESAEIIDLRARVEALEQQFREFRSEKKR